MSGRTALPQPGIQFRYPRSCRRPRYVVSFARRRWRSGRRRDGRTVRGRRRGWGRFSPRDGPLALALLVVVSYLPALQGGFVWDDVIFAEEPVIHSPGALRSIRFSPTDIKNEGHYWPLIYSSFWLEHRLWGLQPAGYHAVNLFLHLLNCLLLWRLLRRLAVPGALLIAAVFAVHPLHLNLGRALFEAGRMEEGLTASRIAVEQRPESAGALANVGRALIYFERLAEAEEYLRRALELDPRSTAAHQNLAEALRAQGRHLEAVESYRTVLELDAGFAFAYAGMGTALFEARRYAEALAALQQALALLPELGQGANLRLVMGRA